MQFLTFTWASDSLSTKGAFQPLKCSPAAYKFPWGSHIAPENHTLHFRGYTWGITAASRVILPSSLCDLCRFLGWDQYSTGVSFILGFVIFHIIRREDFLKIKVVENEKKDSA